MSPDEMDLIQKGARIAGVMPEIEAFLDESDRAIMRAAVMDFNSGKMSPDRAYQAVAALAANAGLRTKLRQTVNIGTSTAERTDLVRRAL